MEREADARAVEASRWRKRQAKEAEAEDEFWRMLDGDVRGGGEGGNEKQTLDVLAEQNEEEEEEEEGGDVDDGGSSDGGEDDKSDEGATADSSKANTPTGSGARVGISGAAGDSFAAPSPVSRALLPPPPPAVAHTCSSCEGPLATKPAATSAFADTCDACEQPLAPGAALLACEPCGLGICGTCAAVLSGQPPPAPASAAFAVATPKSAATGAALLKKAANDAPTGGAGDNAVPAAAAFDLTLSTVSPFALAPPAAAAAAAAAADEPAKKKKKKKKKKRPVSVEKVPSPPLSDDSLVRNLIPCIEPN
jgi:hypothetical protein